MGESNIKRYSIILVLILLIFFSCFITEAEETNTSNVTKSPTFKAGLSLTSETLFSLSQTVVLFITLLILIWQTKLNMKTNKMSQYQDALKMMFECRSDIINNDDLSKLLESNYFEELFSEYGRKEYFILLKVLHTFEIFFLLNKSKIIEADMWNGWKNNLKKTLESKEIRNAWENLESVHIFHQEFIILVDNLIEEIESKETFINHRDTQNHENSEEFSHQITEPKK